MPGRGRGRGQSGRGGRGRRSGRQGAGGEGSDIKSSRSNPPSPICKFFLQGRCNRGDTCRFRHSRDSDALTIKDGAYYASIDGAHDGMWPYMGLEGMMVCLDDEDFLLEQEEEWQDDMETPDGPKLKREENFIALDLENMTEIRSIKDRGLSIASAVLRRVVEGVCPPIVRITRLREEEMSALIKGKQKGNKYFLAGEYAEAFDAYDEALTCVYCHKFYIAPTDQAEEVVNILSNQAECRLRLHDYSGAATIATDALILDSDHDKSRIRRAKAELFLYKDEGDLAYLVQAQHDLKEVLEYPHASALASKTAHGFLEEVYGFLVNEKQKCAEEHPNSDFNMMVREIDSKCW